MKKILANTFQLTGKDTKTNISIPFNLKNNANELHISFLYDPPYSEDETAEKQVIEGLEKYSLSDTDGNVDIQTYLPVENFITVSLSKEGEYIGGHHNKAKIQKIVISKDKASLGFWETPITPGEWEVQLNCHCIASDTLEAEVKIEVT